MTRKKVLVIDDEPDVVTFLTTFLEDHGYETCSAKDGEEGWEKIQKERPDLICLDILMPQKTGVKLYGEIRKDPAVKNTPVVMITAFGPPEHPAIEFKKFIHHRSSVPPPDGYLEKPIDRSALLKTIADILEGRKAQKTPLGNG
ncbi:MAG: response regulator [Proteobacteria bacterium]|nr:response regulator [Pseudomonadota bacterium]